MRELSGEKGAVQLWREVIFFPFISPPLFPLTSPSIPISFCLPRSLLPLLLPGIRSSLIRTAGCSAACQVVGILEKTTGNRRWDRLHMSTHQSRISEDDRWHQTEIKHGGGGRKGGRVRSNPDKRVLHQTNGVQQSSEERVLICAIRARFCSASSNHHSFYRLLLLFLPFISVWILFQT